MQHLVSLDLTVAEIFDILAGRTRITHHLCAVFNWAYIFTADRKKTSDVTSGRFVEPIDSDPPIKFGDRRLNVGISINSTGSCLRRHLSTFFSR